MPILFTAQSVPAHVAVYKLLSQQYASNMSVLPMRSYHVTLSSVINRQATPTLEQYTATLSNHHGRLEEVKRLLQREMVNITFHAVDVRACHIGISPTLLPSTESDIAQLAHLNDVVASALGPLYERQPRNHMSLAYDIPPLNMEPADCRVLEAAVMAQYERLEFVVGPPQLCVFSDMTHFQPL